MSPPSTPVSPPREVSLHLDLGPTRTETTFHTCVRVLRSVTPLPPLSRYSRLPAPVQSRGRRLRSGRPPKVLWVCETRRGPDDSTPKVPFPSSVGRVHPLQHGGSRTSKDVHVTTGKLGTRWFPEGPSLQGSPRSTEVPQGGRPSETSRGHPTSEVPGHRRGPCDRPGVPVSTCFLEPSFPCLTTGDSNETRTPSTVQKVPTPRTSSSGFTPHDPGPKVLLSGPPPTSRRGVPGPWKGRSQTKNSQ